MKENNNMNFTLLWINLRKIEHDGLRRLAAILLTVAGVPAVWLVAVVFLLWWIAEDFLREVKRVWD